jgi:hypothetical protein
MGKNGVQRYCVTVQHDLAAASSCGREKAYTHFSHLSWELEHTQELEKEPALALDSELRVVGNRVLTALKIRRD